MFLKRPSLAECFKRITIEAQEVNSKPDDWTYKGCLDKIKLASNCGNFQLSTPHIKGSKAIKLKKKLEKDSFQVDLTRGFWSNEHNIPNSAFLTIRWG